jgi:pimeloyl-ACP methyl ester carboxylesterase
MKTDNLPAAKSQRKNNKIFVGLSIGFFVFVIIGIAGLVVFRKFAFPGNGQTAEITAPTSVSVQMTTATMEPTQSYEPVFEASPCIFESPEQAQVHCGFVIVPEDRRGAVTDTIRLAVVVFQSSGSTPKPDPILYLQGGPGGKAIEWSVGAYQSVVAPLIGDRDFIVFDPRGVGYSQPALECDEFKNTYLQDIEGKIPKNDKVSYYQGALLSCKNRFLAAGTNVAAYTSHDMAADAKDILIALGYQQANLYAVSYGTRIAQFMMREYPETVRSVILDSVVPVEVQMLNRSNTEQDGSLQILFNDCKSNPECASAYPDLESVYTQVVNQLDAEPIKLDVPIDENTQIQQFVDGSTFHDIVLWTLRTPETIQLVPQLIYRTHEGDNLNLKLSLALPILTFDSISMGTYISVNCHDQVFAMSTERLDNTIYELCALWGSNPPLSSESNPVDSDLPTLVFAGRYDPVTPPSFAEGLAKHLTHSYVAEFPNQGHAPSTVHESNCPIQIISAFLQDPARAPDFTCIGETKPIKYVVPYDESTSLSLEPVRIEAYGVNTRIPAGWSDAQFGFYNRNASLGDITQIGIQRAPVSEPQWLTWLSSNFGGSQGLDQAPIKHDQQQSNGLIWSIYETSSQGNPIEIAFAKSGNQTMMILLICHQDEHDALYNGVFLQIIDSTTSS